MKWNEFKQKAKAKATELKTKAHVFYIQNEEKIWIAVPIVIPAIVGLGKAASKSYNAHMEEQHRLLQQYDPALGTYNQLRRQLTPADWERILQMKRELGITLTECLIRLNLVK